MDAHHISFLELLNGQVQYVVPRWQRRYRWDQSDIERLVEDLLVVAKAGPDAAHYGGALLTFPEPGAAGVVKTIRVVDGQQRLTTVSILLACIAQVLGETGQCGDWTAQIIRDDRLTNPKKPQQKFRKLRLQNGDEEEYRSGLQGKPAGAGAVAQAWRISRRLVARNDVALLLQGLERFRVVSIGLGKEDDPQQIFESLNATGRPLSESEKIKNWLLMGLSDEAQQDLYENCWLRIESSLGARYATQRADVFFRDVLRWWTGKVQGMDQVYEGFRRWAVQEGRNSDRAALSRDLRRLADLYGILTGKAGPHPDKNVERELMHLREMGIDVHRPLTLRLLHDADRDTAAAETKQALAKTVAGIGAWTTRIWLADRRTAGMNRAVVELAHGPGPRVGQDISEYWLGRICRLRNTRVGVPGDEEVQQGVRTRRAYGASATRSSFAILCALMEAEHTDPAPARASLTIEHIMPQTLTEDWKHSLGEEAEEIHGRYRHRFANLTLSGDVTNPKLSTKPFDAKKQTYANSPIGLTRRLAEEGNWDQDALDRRADQLAQLALNRWPWNDEREATDRDADASAILRWRVDDGPWHSETSAFQMVLNVAGALLSQNPENAHRLSGDAISVNVHPASLYPPGQPAGALLMHEVPGHPEYVLYPYGATLESVKRCQRMGERCGLAVDARFEGSSRNHEFWRFLKANFGGVPGQREGWRGPGQWTSSMNALGDRIGIYVGHAEWLWIYIRAGESEPSAQRTKRMRRYSLMIRSQMADQELGEKLEEQSLQGRTISVQQSWVREDEDGWYEAAQWIKEQSERLRVILDNAQ